MTNHPSEETLALFAEGRLDAPERDAVTAHVGICDECLSAVAAARAARPSEGIPRILPRWRAVAALWVGALAFGALYPLEPPPPQPIVDWGDCGKYLLTQGTLLSSGKPLLAAQRQGDWQVVGLAIPEGLEVSGGVSLRIRLAEGAPAVAALFSRDRDPLVIPFRMSAEGVAEASIRTGESAGAGRLNSGDRIDAFQIAVRATEGSLVLEEVRLDPLPF